MTEGRIPAFHPEVAPELLRTKRAPVIEAHDEQVITRNTNKKERKGR